MRLLSARGICNRSFCSPLLNWCEGQPSIVQTNVSETGIQEEERFYQKGHSIKNHLTVSWFLQCDGQPPAAEEGSASIDLRLRLTANWRANKGLKAISMSDAATATSSLFISFSCGGIRLKRSERVGRSLQACERGGQGAKQGRVRERRV